MAFQAPALPNIIATTADLWPSMKALFAVPRRPVGRIATSPEQQHNQVRDRAEDVQQPVKLSISSLPEFFDHVQPSTLPIFGHRIAMQTPFTTRTMLSAISKGKLASANPLARNLLPNTFSTRSIATISAFQKSQRKTTPMLMLRPQQRTLFGSSASRNILAHMEEVANKNPSSATAQNAFYQALLRANMGAIVVERYQNGNFASNAACEATYQKALAGLGQADAGLAGSTYSSPALNSHQIQAIGQAVAASSRGGNVATARGLGVNGGTGAKEAPLHVVVEETIGGTIFKWVKFFFYFFLVTYVCMALITVLVEFLGTFKKITGKGGNEAKAEQQTVRFTDVHGCDEAKEELQELVEFLKNPEKFSTLGGKLPKGVLLVGPPGTGKTLLARAVAGEAGVPFFFMSGSEFDEVYVGVGAKRVRELFTAAKAKSPAIVFIDELDAIGGKRNARDAAYSKQTLNQLLTELDGFDQNSGVIILGATNFPEMLDKALTRPGRFDRNVVVGLPDVRGRIAILKHHMKRIIPSGDVNLEALAAGTPGFSGAELENVINQAAVHASKAKAQAVSMLDLEWAKDKVMMGAERRSMIISPKEKEMTAYHEAGHALVGLFTSGSHPLHKVTIMPRGQALGITFHLPEMDKYSATLTEYLAQIDVALGGKVAEALIYGDKNVTSGVASDLQKATQIAYAMVTQFGMSSKLGNVDLASNHNRLSSETKRLIESEVRRTIEEGRERVERLLQDHKRELDLLARALIDYETLDKEEVLKILKGEQLPSRTKQPIGNIKLPEPSHPAESFPGPGGMGLPAIPGSGDDAADVGRPPPKGGVMA